MVKVLPHKFKVFRKVHKGLVRRYEGPFSGSKEVKQKATKDKP